MPTCSWITWFCATSFRKPGSTLDQPSAGSPALVFFCRCAPNRSTAFTSDVGSAPEARGSARKPASPPCCEKDFLSLRSKLEAFSVRLSGVPSAAAFAVMG